MPAHDLSYIGLKATLMSFRLYKTTDVLGKATGDVGEQRWSKTHIFVILSYDF